MKSTQSVSKFLLFSMVAAISIPANAAYLRGARYAPAFDYSRNSTAPLELKNVPDFSTNGNIAPNQTAPGGPADNDNAGTALKADVSSTTIPIETRLRLILETPVDAKMSQPGDIFEAHV